MSTSDDPRVPLGRSYRLQAECYRATAEARELEGRPRETVLSLLANAQAYDRMAERLEAHIQADAELAAAWARADAAAAAFAAASSGEPAANADGTPSPDAFGVAEL